MVRKSPMPCLFPLTAEGRFWLEIFQEVSPTARETLCIVLEVLLRHDPVRTRRLQAIVAETLARLSPEERQVHEAATAAMRERRRQARSQDVN